MSGVLASTTNGVSGNGSQAPIAGVNGRAPAIGMTPADMTPTGSVRAPTSPPAQFISPQKPEAGAVGSSHSVMGNGTTGNGNGTTTTSNVNISVNGVATNASSNPASQTLLPAPPPDRSLSGTNPIGPSGPSTSRLQIPSYLKPGGTSKDSNNLKQTDASAYSPMTNGPESPCDEPEEKNELPHTKACVMGMLDAFAGTLMVLGGVYTDGQMQVLLHLCHILAVHHSFLQQIHYLLCVLFS